MEPNFWRGKRVFVTGHTGFKGRWLITWLGMLGAEVSGYSLPHRVEHSRGVETAVARNTDIVIHMAAQAIVSKGYDDPLGTFETNTKGTYNILDEVTRWPRVKAVLVVTSDKADTSDTDPYTVSKRAASDIATCYRESYGFPVAEARAGNVIGGGDWSENRLIPDIMRAKEADKHIPTLLKLRQPESIRPWQHVLDCLNGYLTVIERLWETDKAAKIWHVGPLECSTTAAEIVSFFNCPCVIEMKEETFRERKILNIATDFVPKLNTRQALGWTKIEYAGASMESEIERYMKL